MSKQIFIGGCPRSGTTLLGAMLGSSPDILCVPESQFKTDLLKSNTLADPGKVISKIQKSPRFKLWQLELPANFSGGSSKAGSEIFEGIVAQYGKLKSKTNYRSWVDHTPCNLINAPLILKEFPEARFIHIVRDGRGVAASILPLDWGPNTIKYSAAAWIGHLAYGFAVEANYPKQAKRVKYEDLVEKPAETLKELCEWLGIGFVEAMVSGSGFELPKYTKKQHSLVGKGVNSNRATAWQKSLSPAQIQEYEFRAGDMLKLLGYPLLFPEEAKLRKTLWNTLSREGKELFYSRVVNPMRNRKRLKTSIP